MFRNMRRCIFRGKNNGQLIFRKIAKSPSFNSEIFAISFNSLLMLV